MQQALLVRSTKPFVQAVHICGAGTSQSKQLGNVDVQQTVFNRLRNLGASQD